MKKAIKITVVLIFAGFLAAQFFRPGRTNPPVVQTETLQSSTTIPADVQTVFTRSCSDCHSNETSYPWYSNISPFSWFLAGHIEEGRRELNFSIWNTYSQSKKNKKLEEICEQVESGAMPLPSYLWIHRDAVLTDSDKKLLCDWTAAAKAEGGNPD
ncbi:MAG: heme-binding domain-containing protein [Pyrinomonadaceae bacterium]